MRQMQEEDVSADAGGKTHTTVLVFGLLIIVLLRKLPPNLRLAPLHHGTGFSDEPLDGLAAAQRGPDGRRGVVPITRDAEDEQRVPRSDHLGDVFFTITTASEILKSKFA